MARCECGTVATAHRKKGADRSRLLRKRQELRGLLSHLGFCANQEGGNVGNGAPVLDAVAKRERVLLGTSLCRVEIRLFGHAIQPRLDLPSAD
jgi:hypothetical protein